MFFAPRPGALPCHPERSGTTRQKSRATTNHRRTANPAPSGAPAGGISVAKRHHATPRTIQHPQFDIFSKRGLTERGKSCIIEPSQCDLGNINTVAVASSFIGGSNFFLPPKRSEGGDKMGYITLQQKAVISTKSGGSNRH